MDEEPWWHDPRDEAAGGRDSVGSAAEEASRLFMALRDRVLSDPTALRAGLRIRESMSSQRAGTGTPVAPGGAPECAYCPVCQAMTRAKNINPESVERLTGAAMEFAETVRRILGSPDDDTGTTVHHVPLDDDLDGFAGWPDPVDVPADPEDKPEPDQ